MNFEPGDILVWSNNLAVVVLQVDRHLEECKFKYFGSEEKAREWRDSTALRASGECEKT